MISFSSIFGQQSAIESILRAYEADRLPHGLIFAGPAGVGKATTARALGALFLCESPKQHEPCGKCESCVVMEAGNHPDFHTITKELIRYHDKTGKSKGIDLSIHVLRPELIEPANRKAVMNRGKVFVVEQAELMNPQAQNSILKTLEEPQGRTLIILLTDSPEWLLPTIRSRCQLIRFGWLEADRVIKELQKRNISPTDARDAVRFAGPSLGLAIKWLQDGVIEPARQLVAMLDAGRTSDLPEFFKKNADDYATKQLDRDELASKDQANREGLGIYLRIAADHLRHQLRTTDDPEHLERLAAGIDVIIRAEQYLDANVNVALIFQQLAMSLPVGSA
jgi:DNA polymerase-3 subunit delta'